MSKRLDAFKVGDAIRTIDGSGKVVKVTRDVNQYYPDDRDCDMVTIYTNITTEKGTISLYGRAANYKGGY